METKLMQRIFTANNEGEDPVLDQLEADISRARNKGSLRTDEVDYKRQGNNVLIHDKVNDEYTLASESDSNISLQSIRSLIGKTVNWNDGGIIKSGLVIDINQHVAKILCNENIVTIETYKLMESTSRSYSKSRANMFLVNDKGSLIAHGWLQSLMKLKQSNPGYKIISNYDWNAIKNGLKNLRQFSESIQRQFTRSNNTWVVLDKSMKLVGLFDLTNARGLVKLNPGYTMIRKIEWNTNNQPKVKGFSI